jgi:hypothetical protein
LCDTEVLSTPQLQQEIVTPCIPDPLLQEKKQIFRDF